MCMHVRVHVRVRVFLQSAQSQIRSGKKKKKNVCTTLDSYPHQQSAAKIIDDLITFRTHNTSSGQTGRDRGKDCKTKR